MEHIAALLLVIGCSDDLAQCRELPAPTPIFETAQECEVEVPHVLSAYMNEFPQIMAQCIAVDPLMEEADAELVWDINPDGTLYAAVEIPDVLVATRDGRGEPHVNQE